MNIYGHFHIGNQTIHYVTFVCMVVLGIFYLYRLRNLNTPFSLKILLPCLYVFGALMHYEIVWNFGWAFFSTVGVVDCVGFALCESLIVYALWLMKDKYHYDVPQVNIRRWIFVTGVMTFMMWWLYSIGFYKDYRLFYLGQTTEDPHNFAWAIGKTCLLSWLWVPDF